MPEFPNLPRRKVQFTGSSYVITLPKEYFTNNKISVAEGKKFITLFNKHILIINPNEEEKILSRMKGALTIENVMRAILDG